MKWPVGVNAYDADIGFLLAVVRPLPARFLILRYALFEGDATIAGARLRFGGCGALSRTRPLERTRRLSALTAPVSKNRLRRPLLSTRGLTRPRVFAQRRRRAALVGRRCCPGAWRARYRRVDEPERPPHGTCHVGRRSGRPIGATLKSRASCIGG